MRLPLTPLTPRVHARRRDRDAVQFGVGSAHSRYVDRLTAEEIDALVSLGGLTVAQWSGVLPTLDDGTRWAHLTPLLMGAVLAQEVPCVAGRVTVDGPGPVAEAITSVLTAMGCSVLPAAVARVVRHRLDLVVVVGSEAVPARRLDAWQRIGSRVLPVAVTADRVDLGPLLGAAEGPCAECVDLARCDLDPAWPALAAQLVLPPSEDGDVATVPELVAGAAGLAGLVLRGLSSGQELPPGISLSLATPATTIGHHLWRRHPLCACGRLGLTGS
ncbi:hypothetical protein G9U51_11895 [Calidifontibacter sp. DB0510]|uniref:TOMM leader peptide-binding protein n=1 Tax=Metallococcus carri TaxID=1656884 RepID=A0A967B332_9MICO|nr:hypothetical protein [Metallococcus carri]NHN56480.1 hypothetical protein [Metallococcus carri]NOP36104.1 hypothetical protein [Calidifontibacter sp. DB2511S]